MNSASFAWLISTFFICPTEGHMPWIWGLERGRRGVKGWNDAWSHLCEGGKWGACVRACMRLHNARTGNVYVCPLVLFFFFSFFRPCHGFVLVRLLLNLHTHVPAWWLPSPWPLHATTAASVHAHIMPRRILESLCLVSCQVCLAFKTFFAFCVFFLFCFFNWSSNPNDVLLCNMAERVVVF